MKPNPLSKGHVRDKQIYAKRAITDDKVERHTFSMCWEVDRAHHRTDI